VAEGATFEDIDGPTDCTVATGVGRIVVGGNDASDPPGLRRCGQECWHSNELHRERLSSLHRERKQRNVVLIDVSLLTLDVAGNGSRYIDIDKP
jgi:hypothetical protein